MIDWHSDGVVCGSVCTLRGAGAGIGKTWCWIRSVLGTASRDHQLYPINRRSPRFCFILCFWSSCAHTSAPHSLSFALLWVDTQGLAASVMVVWIGWTLQRRNEEGRRRRRRRRRAAQDEPDAGIASRIGRLSLLHWLYISITPLFRNCASSFTLSHPLGSPSGPH